MLTSGTHFYTHNNLRQTLTGYWASRTGTNQALTKTNSGGLALAGITHLSYNSTRPTPQGISLWLDGLVPKTRYTSLTIDSQTYWFEDSYWNQSGGDTNFRWAPEGGSKGGLPSDGAASVQITLR